MEFLEIVLGAIIGVLGSLAFTFWKKYSEKKAENVATIEDTALITRIEETIKNTFRIELAKIELGNQHQFTVAIEKRNAIFNYNDSLYKLYYASWHSMFELRYSKDDRLKLFSEDLRKVDSKYRINFERLKLFFQDDSFDKIENSLQKNITEAQQITLRFFGNSEKLTRNLNEGIKSKVDDWKIEALRAEVYENIRSSSEKVTKVTKLLLPDLINIRNVLNTYIEEVFDQEPNDLS